MVAGLFLLQVGSLGSGEVNNVLVTKGNCHEHLRQAEEYCLDVFNDFEKSVFGYFDRDEKLDLYVKCGSGIEYRALSIKSNYTGYGFPDILEWEEYKPSYMKEKY